MSSSPCKAAKESFAGKETTADAVKRAAILLIAFVALGQAAPVAAQSQPQLGTADAAKIPASKIGGTVVDASGALVENAKVTLTQPNQSLSGQPPKRDTVTDSVGQFTFSDLTPGPFQLTISLSGFSTYESTDVLQPGENHVIPLIALSVARADVDVEVKIAPEQIAEDEVKAEEKQRLFGVIPNYYMTFDPHAAPLTTRLKFQLAWKNSIDPVSFGIVGAIAGFEQAADSYGGYGQGAAGYARRYGAAYGDFVSATFIGGAILPSLLKQDPRYFYKGTGTAKARLEYALANAVIRKGDNGRWQPDYSGILGGLAAGGISNLYYPDADRNGARLTFENTAIGIGFTGAVNIVQEFLFKKLTTHAADPNIDKQSDK